jgi:hypothetical protein
LFTDKKRINKMEGEKGAIAPREQASRWEKEEYHQEEVSVVLFDS